MSTHRCPGPACETQVPADQLACRRHPVAAEQRHERAMHAAIAEMKP